MLLLELNNPTLVSVIVHTFVGGIDFFCLSQSTVMYIDLWTPRDSRGGRYVHMCYHDTCITLTVYITIQLLCKLINGFKTYFITFDDFLFIQKSHKNNNWRTSSSSLSWVGRRLLLFCIYNFTLLLHVVFKHMTFEAAGLTRSWGHVRIARSLRIQPLFAA